MAETLSPDYLVIGAGGMGMAFIDTLLTDTIATVAIVDRYHCPGGHWTTAYPFVRLHQPSAFYGVNSKHLGQNKVDAVGLNRGLHELATADEVLAYYDQVMNQQFLPSGRATYFPNSEYASDGRFRSLITGKTYRVEEKTRIVDSTFMRVTVPSMGRPAYSIAHDVQLVTPNDLVKITRPYANYTVIGGGKTGIDTCLWLLKAGIDSSDITWIMPRDSWLFNRHLIQPGEMFASVRLNGVRDEGNAIMAATSVDDLFKRIEGLQRVVRISDDVKPTMFRCATISLAELENLKKIKNIVRNGRVLQIGADELKLDGGSYKPIPDTLYIDCSADGLAKTAPVPVFSGKKIILQPVRYCQQVFSAAFIAHVEAAYDDEKLKNDLCRVIPHPDEAIDWLITNIQTLKNAVRWNQEPKTVAWLGRARLDFYGRDTHSQLPEDPEARRKVLGEVATKFEALCDKLEKLLGDSPQAENASAQLARWSSDG